MIKISIRRLWRDLSIKNKQLLFFIVIMLIVVSLNTYTQLSARSYMTIFNHNLSSYFSIDNLRVSVFETHSHIENYLKTKSIDELEMFQAGRKRIHIYLSKVEQEADTGIETHFQINAMRYGLIAYFDAVDKAMEDRRQNEELYYLHLLKANRILQYLQNYLEQLIRIRFQEDRTRYASLLREAARMLKVSVGGIIVMVLMFIGFAYLFSHGITGPVRDLAHASMKIAGGKLDVPDIKVHSRDEVGILAESFNTMSRNIHEMVEGLKQKSQLEKKLHEDELKIVKMEQSLKEAQFLGLQSQINPHFLFNTLNTISRVAAFEHADTSMKLIESLANMFRYNLRDGAGEISLEEELKITREYLHIQELRFSDRFCYEIDCRLDPTHISLPTFTLQPLLENAVRHGIEPKESGGRVRIKISRKNATICIKIHDTGIGMGPEKLAELRSSLAAPMDNALHSSANSGIGIKNVAGRLSLYFNGKSSLNIYSKRGFGTLVTLTLPEKEEV
jgi:sensor histidine kinase YesM